MKRFHILTLLALCGWLQATAQRSMELPASEVARQMGIGWNLGNTLEAGDQKNNFTNRGGLGAETWWQDTRTTQAVIDYVKSLGFRSVRIPCAWVMGHISDPSTNTIDAAWMARVREVVDYCISAGLYVVINQHWDGGWLENNITASGAAKDKNLKVLTEVWTQIATTFRDYDERLLFAGLNEPNAETQAATNALLDYEQAFVDAVRATGGNNAQRVLVVQGPSTDIERTCSYMNRLPTDTATDRLMLEVHYYNPWQFWGMEKDESWGNVFYYWGQGNHVSGSKHNATWGEEADMRQQLQKMKTRYVDKGVPVLLGEFGANWRTISGAGESQQKHDASIKAHYRLLCQLALEMGMVPMMWDTNYRGRPSMTIVDRKRLSVYNPHMMSAISEAMLTAGVSSPKVEHRAEPLAVYDLKGRRYGVANALPAGEIYIKGGRKYVSD